MNQEDKDALKRYCDAIDAGIELSPQQFARYQDLVAQQTHEAGQFDSSLSFFHLFCDYIPCLF